jgi:hypothetical protein
VQVVVPPLPGDGDVQLNVRALSLGDNKRLVLDKVLLDKAVGPGSFTNLKKSVFRSVLSTRNDGKAVFGIIFRATVWSDSENGKAVFGVTLRAKGLIRVNDTNVVFGSVTSSKRRLVAGSGPWLTMNKWNVKLEPAAGGSGAGRSNLLT